MFTRHSPSPVRARGRRRVTPRVCPPLALDLAERRTGSSVALLLLIKRSAASVQQENENGRFILDTPQLDSVLEGRARVPTPQVPAVGGGWLVRGARYTTYFFGVRKKVAPRGGRKGSEITVFRGGAEGVFQSVPRRKTEGEGAGRNKRRAGVTRWECVDVWVCRPGSRKGQMTPLFRDEAETDRPARLVAHQLPCLAAGSARNVGVGTGGEVLRTKE